nr:hypothetical protein [Tanacetum cinerariifolium]
KAQMHHGRPYPNLKSQLLISKPKIFPPMRFKGIAKLSKGCVLGCDQVLDSRGGGEDNKQ